MPSYLITGCSRGLGLALVSALVTTIPDALVFATSRSSEPSPALQALITIHPNRIHHVPMDVTSPSSISTATAIITTLLNGSGLDVLINSAGTQFKEPTGLHQSLSHLPATISTNVLAPHNTILALLPLLRKGHQRKIINISTTLASLSLANNFAFAADVPSYKISKAALNMLGVLWGMELEEEGFVVVGVSPGWLRTGLGGEKEGSGEAHLSAEEGARAVVEVIEGLGKDDNGSFRNIRIEGSEMYRGEAVPW